MNYSEYEAYVDLIKESNERIYGNYGFDYKEEWDGNTVSAVQITWPKVESCYLDHVYRFAEALSAACFEGAKLIGTMVED